MLKSGQRGSGACPVDKLPDPVAYAVPFFVLLIVIEMIWAKRRAPESYEPKDTLSSLMFGLGSQVVGALTAFAAVAVYMTVYDWRVMTIPYAWWSWILCFVLDDFLYYVFHRTAHRVRWFWAAHVNHHSSQHYNLSTALRQTWTGFFALSFLFDAPLFLIGFPPAMVFFVGALNLVYQFWIHTEAIDRTPRWFEAVMNTPSHHRVHHATNPRYLDRNFAGVFIIWDKMFGTFVTEADKGVEPIRYGIIKQLGTFNLPWSVFHEWIGIFRDMRAAPFGSKLRYVFGPPGWSHDGTRETSDMIRRRWINNAADERNDDSGHI
jgi:sterol desaturase/sphingolipid hydroxylase (fatty acid hydroxylase superfamily)